MQGSNNSIFPKCYTTVGLIILMIIFNCSFAQRTFAQKKTYTLTGVVYDEQLQPLTGASVLVAGTTRGVITDLDGKYSIKVSKGETVTFSFLGYEKVAIPIKTQTKLDVKLQLSKKTNLDEVVVIGYGTTKKIDMTGSVTNVKMADLQSSPVTSVDQALQGRIAGADIMSTTGEPGATTSIRIRGTRSITASNEPLIVVDGVMDGVNDMNDINPADIESISVLKDASSTAIYGSRGSNGVIIITTKQGKQNQGKPTIVVKAETGFSQIPHLLDVMDQSEFARYRNDIAYFFTSQGYENIKDGTPLNQYPFNNPLSLGKGTDWQKEITRTAVYQNYNASLSGRTTKDTYYASINYNNTQGIIQNSGLIRYSGRLNVDRQLFKWMKIGYKGSYTWRQNDENLADIGGNNYWKAAIYLSPMISAQDNFNPFWGNGQTINTPRATLDQNTYYTQRVSINHTAFMDFNILKDLKLHTQASYTTYNRHIFRYYPSTLPAKKEGEGGEAYRGEYYDHQLLAETTLSYKHSWNKSHNFDILGGYTCSRFESNNATISGKGYMDDNVKWNNMNAVIDKETYSIGTSTSKIQRMSFLARANYNYKQRYYLTVTGRADGSSNFAANHKWGFFPSVALKWNFTNESFMKNVDWTDEISLRISGGRTGNDAISAYRSIAALSSTTSGYLFDGSQPVAYYPSRLDSPNLTWEKTDLYNLALDMSFLKNRLNITAEGYISKTKDLLLTVQTASQTGYTSRYANFGNTSNKGVELSIESRNIVNKNFSWTTNFTIAHNKQNVDDIGSEDFVVAMTSAGNNKYMMNGYVKDYPINAMWGFKYGGTWKSLEEFERNDVTKAYVNATTISANATSRKAALGNPRYYDINHDGLMSEEDLVYLGNADPDIYGGLQNTFKWKGLSLSAYFTYSLGGYIYNYSELYMSGSDMTNQYRYMLNGWHHIRNPYSDIPRAGCVDTHVPSSFQIHDASYLRFKSLNISYTFNLQNKTKVLRNLTLGITGENLYLWSHYNGYDPDVSSSSGDSSLRRVDMGAYPKARTFVFSIQATY